MFEELTRVRNPQAKLIKDVQGFMDNPQPRAERIRKIGRQEGYSFIEAASLGLLQMAKDAGNEDAFRYAALLTQPRWQFHTTEETNCLAVVVSDDGDSVVIGKYSTGGSEAGAVELLMDEPSICLLEATEDPRDAFISTFIKQKVFKKGRKYFVVDCSKDRKYLQHFYAEDRIKQTRKPGYLWKFDAYVITDGPFLTKEEAKEAKIKIIKE